MAAQALTTVSAAYMAGAVYIASEVPIVEASIVGGVLAALSCEFLILALLVATKGKSP